MDLEQLAKLINSLKAHPESEVLEFKEAKQHFKTADLGRYFSALSNEANLKGLRRAWLLFGVRDDGSVCGTGYRQESTIPSKGLLALKRDIANETNNRITFCDVHELFDNDKRIVAFEIPSATRGIPTLWAGAAYAREGEHLVPLPMDKIDEIRSQPPLDWSKKTIPGASIEHLDPGAVAIAREKMKERYGERAGLVDVLDDAEMLDKMGMTLRGSVTNAALMLLGSEDAVSYFEGPVPKITWSLYESNGSVRTYEHFSPPFLVNIDKLLSKIRNEKYRLLDDPRSLIPHELSEYDDWSLRELIGNAIAHQAYERGGKININEFPDHIEIMNEGGFIPGTIEAALGIGYKPPYYRNPFLCDAMIHVKMLDQNAMGIRTVYQNAIERHMPLPNYDLDDPQRVKVEMLNHEMNRAYTHILFEKPDMSLHVAFLLDKVQKGKGLSPLEFDMLALEGLAEKVGSGEVRLVDPAFERVPISTEEGCSGSEAVDSYRAARRATRNAVLRLLHERPLQRTELVLELEALPETHPYLDEHGDQRVYALLKRLRIEGLVASEGNTRAKVWFAIDE